MDAKEMKKKDTQMKLFLEHAQNQLQDYRGDIQI